MNSSIKPFFIPLAIVSAFSVGILIVWKQFAPVRFQTDLAWAIWVFFVLSTTAIHVILMKQLEAPKKFVFYFMSLTGVKLFSYLMIILIYALLKRQAALGFTLFFLTMYLIYTGLEVFMLLKQLNK